MIGYSTVWVDCSIDVWIGSLAVTPTPAPFLLGVSLPPASLQTPSSRLQETGIVLLSELYTEPDPRL